MKYGIFIGSEKCIFSNGCETMKHHSFSDLMLMAIKLAGRGSDGEVTLIESDFEDGDIGEINKINFVLSALNISDDCVIVTNNAIINRFVSRASNIEIRCGSINDFAEKMKEL